MSKSRLRRLKVENLKSFGFEPPDKRDMVKLVDRPSVSQLPVIPVEPQPATTPAVVFETPTTVTPVKASDVPGLAVPVEPSKVATPEQLQNICRQWASLAVQRLVEHAMSEDYRAALPAIQMLLNRGFGKERDLPEASPQASLVAAMPVRERIKALLAARDTGEGAVSPTDKPIETAKEPSPLPASEPGQEMGNATG